MKADHGATPIPLPNIVDDPRWIGRFSREVRKSIAALRDRKIIVRGRQGRGGKITLPWQVTLDENGDAVVGPGKIATIKTVLTNEFRGVFVPMSYPGEVLTAGGPGWVYVVLEYTYGAGGGYEEFFDSNFTFTVAPKFATAFDVVFSPIAPGDLTDTEIDSNERLWIPIAEIQEDENENLSVDQHVYDNLRVNVEYGEMEV